MLPIDVLQHSTDAPPGWLGDALRRSGRSWSTTRLDRGEPLPDASRLAALVVLGGEMGAYDEETHPFLALEKDLIRRAVGADLPVLGICLGAQLVADALGGAAYLADGPEVGVVEIHLTEAGRAEPGLSSMSGPVFVMHQDTFDLPPGAVLLAANRRFPQAFRLGSALAVQFHPETPPAIAGRWLDGAPELLERAEVSASDVKAQLRRAAPVLAADAAVLFDEWLRSLGPGGDHGDQRGRRSR